MAENELGSHPTSDNQASQTCRNINIRKTMTSFGNYQNGGKVTLPLDQLRRNERVHTEVYKDQDHNLKDHGTQYDDTSHYDQFNI